MTPLQHIRQHLGPIVLLVPLLSFLVAGTGGLYSCSTTKNLPEEEILYTGVREIAFNSPLKKKKKKQRLSGDSVGVITTIAETVKSIGDIFSGEGTASATQAKKKSPNASLTKEEKRALKETQKTEAQALESVQEEVEAVLSYPPNYSLFGSATYRSPFQPGLWTYNAFVHSKKGLGRWIFKHFSSTPVFISSVNPELRAQVATNTLHNYGFFNGEVREDVQPYHKHRKAKVSYRVETRGLYTLDSISYPGYWPSADSLLQATRQESLLKRGDPFQVVKLSEEQKRLETLMRNEGFYYYEARHTTFRADTTAVHGKVQLQATPVGNIPAKATHRWYIGRTKVISLRNNTDSLRHTTHIRDCDFLHQTKKIPVRYGVYRRALLLRHGMPYNQDLSKLSLEKLGEMGIFSQIDLSYTPRDTSALCDTLDILLLTQTDKRYSAELQMNVTSKSNDQIGPGLSLGLSKKNAFRGGENLDFRLYGSYEWQTGVSGGRRNNDLQNSYELGASLDLKYPRLILPFASRRLRRIPSSTVFSLHGDWTERANFFNMITFGANVTYKWRKTRTSQHEFTPFSLDYTQLGSTTAAFDSIMTANPALYVSMRDQFVPALSYTYTYSSPKGARSTLWWQTSVKEAGNLTAALYSIAGQEFSKKGKRLLGNPFAQFVKLTSEVRKSFPLSESVTLATRLMGGVVWSFGNSLSAPYKEQFWIGGANSVRAFTTRTVGPGRFEAFGSKYSYMDQTGDVKLEANAELRFPIWGNLHGATFLDVGNVWLLRDEDERSEGKFKGKDILKSLALGTGCGLRYDMEFIVLRLDLGVALHAPYETGKSGFYNIRRFSDGLALHFAVGYPF